MKNLARRALLLRPNAATRSLRTAAPASAPIFREQSARKRGGVTPKPATARHHHHDDPWFSRCITTSCGAHYRVFAFVVLHFCDQMEKKKIEDSPWNTDLANSLLTADVQQMMDDKGSGLDAGGMALHYVNDDDTVQACAEEMWRLRIGSVVAKNAATGDIAGIVTERDFVKALATEVQPGTRAVSETLLVSDVMTPASKLVWVTPRHPVGDCMDLMREHGIRHLPVVCEDTARNVLEGKPVDDPSIVSIRLLAGQSNTAPDLLIVAIA